MKEITYEELHGMPKDSYILIDIRDEGLVSYGMIPGAMNLPLNALEEELGKKIGKISKEKIFPL